MPIEVDIHSASESSWIDSTYPTHGDSEVGRTDDIKVRFTKFLSPDCVINENFRLYEITGDEVDGAFKPISYGNDFNPITKELTLYPAIVLEPSSDYTLVIRDLFDAGGDDQDQNHVVSFKTNEFDADLTADAGETSAINVVDHTINNADLNFVTTEADHTAYMDPSDGSYNVDSATEILSFLLSPADLEDGVTELTSVVKRRVISNMETSWETLAAEAAVVDTGHISITLPSQSGVYVADGYEYTVSLTVGSDTFSFEFCGELDPMFSSVSNVIMQAPDLSSYQVAKSIYLSSAYIVDLSPTLASTPTKAALDYAMYNTLASLTPIDTMEGYTLADLEVKRSTSAQQKWADLAAQALAKIDSAAPRFLVKGSANTSPHAKRDFGSTLTRIGK